MAEEKESVSYETLQDLLRSERRSNKLMPVPARFWFQVRDFLAAVTEQFRVEQAKDPFGRKVMLLTDEVKNARHAAEALWALRERKLALLALAGPKDRKVPDGVTPDEGALFHDFVRILDDTRGRVFAGTIAAPGILPPAVEAPSPVVPAGQAPVSAPARPSHTPPAPAVPGPAAVTVPSDTRLPAEALVTIRALGDIPPFVGPDMQTYLLKSGDVATVPPSIAQLLVRRSKAAVVDGA